jgi:hypothetical protein
MVSYEIARAIQSLWERKPEMVVLLGLGFLVFLLLVVDAWWHKRRRKRRRLRH